MARALIWLRRDLRLTDHPAFASALEAGLVPVPVYIHDEPCGDWPLGAASAWWLHHSLDALDRQLRAVGSRLILRRGDPVRELLDLAHTLDAKQVFWNRLYEPRTMERDRAVKIALREQGVEVHSCPGNLLQEPWQLLKADDTPYRVFTPYWNALQKRGVAPPAGAARIPALKGRVPASLKLKELALLPDLPWDAAFPDHWQPGEEGALAALERLIDESLSEYTLDRDRPDLPGTSRLSPHLHFGEITPRFLWATLEDWSRSSDRRGRITAAESWLRQLSWRDFAHQLLYHFPHTPDAPLDERFAHFPWAQDYEDHLHRWQRGRTGIPIVDAGMRELWTSGWMHNRVRMIVASLLTKNLRIPWQEGARWFWDTLVDADLANNTMGWQWVAGCGADAAPYFRIFNPVRQGERFDPDGDYVRRWVPELAKLPAKWIHQPWAAPAAVLEQAGVAPGKNYPLSMVDLAESRKRALEAWNDIKHR